jgi:ketosteroid isomerase-like protein
MQSISELVSGFIEALSASDVERALAYFVPDACYQEAEREPMIGHKAIGDHFRGFVSLSRTWHFHIDDVIQNRTEDAAAIVYRFSIEGRGAEQFERQGCALVKRLGQQFVQWREYKG